MKKFLTAVAFVAMTVFGVEAQAQHGGGHPGGAVGHPGGGYNHGPVYGGGYARGPVYGGYNRGYGYGNGFYSGYGYNRGAYRGYSGVGIGLPLLGGYGSYYGNAWTPQTVSYVTINGVTYIVYPDGTMSVFSY